MTELAPATTAPAAPQAAAPAAASEGAGEAAGQAASSAAQQPPPQTEEQRLNDDAVMDDFFRENPADADDAHAEDDPDDEQRQQQGAELTAEQQRLVKRFKLDPATNRALKLMTAEERTAFLGNLKQRADFVDQLVQQRDGTQPSQPPIPGVPMFGLPQQPPNQQPAIDPAGQPPPQPQQQQDQQGNPWAAVGEYFADPGAVDPIRRGVEATVQQTLSQIPALQHVDAMMQSLQAIGAWLQNEQFERGLREWQPPPGIDKDDPAVRERIREAAARVARQGFDPVRFTFEHAVPLAASAVFNQAIMQAAQKQHAQTAAQRRRASPAPTGQAPTRQQPLTESEIEDDWFRRNPAPVDIEA